MHGKQLKRDAQPGSSAGSSSMRGDSVDASAKLLAEASSDAADSVDASAKLLAEASSADAADDADNAAGTAFTCFPIVKKKDIYSLSACSQEMAAV
jgi:hypothetical protein